MSYARVCRIDQIYPHGNADRLDVLIVKRHALVRPQHGDVAVVDPEILLVTGKHYRKGDLGVWLRPGALIPGWLAHDLWLVGKNRATEAFTVREIEIRGVRSEGLWCGQWYRNDSSKESRLRADELARGGGQIIDGWIGWARWNPSWEIGDAVDIELGVVAA